MKDVFAGARGAAGVRPSRLPHNGLRRQRGAAPGSGVAPGFGRAREELSRVARRGARCVVRDRCPAVPGRGTAIFCGAQDRRSGYSARNIACHGGARVGLGESLALSATVAIQVTARRGATRGPQARPERSARIVPAIAPPGPDNGRATRASRGSPRTAAGVSGPLRRRRGACPCRASRGDP